jgi:hypothetical protein
VPQPPGEGLYRRVQEPTTKAWYRLYLPVDYVRNNGRHPDPEVKRWPLVMTFHGMKPYDSAPAQEKEWEKEADAYGYIVCAPELRTSDSFMEYPLTKEHGYVLEDKQNVLAIMRHLFATTRADPDRVLSTSWSCGGYLAHYFPNRFPEMFSCIATRLSNFSHKLMTEGTVPRYRDKTPVAIYIGDGDFPACKTESENAVAWYLSRKFRVVRGKMIDRMGHRRIPQVAAAFFAEQLGIEPLRPMEAGKTLAQVQMTDYYPPQQLIARMSPRTPATAEGTAIAAGRGSAAARSRRTLPRIAAPSSLVYEPATAGRNYPFSRRPSYDPNPERDSIRAARRSPPTVPATGAGATRVAKHPRAQSNWLEAPKNPARPVNSPGGRKKLADVTPPSGRRSPPLAGVTGDRTRGRAGPGSGSPEAGRGPRTADPTPPGSGAKPALAGPIPDNASRRFNPKDAGPRDYDRRLAQRTQSGDRRATDRAKDPTRRRSDARRGSSTATKSAVRPRGSSRAAKRVSVRLSGPAVGTAPHYIAYSVDLPRTVLDGADCLWMDNGVWISDEPRGVKILETPGQHLITALIVTRANVVYRGSATVFVLE